MGLGGCWAPAVFTRLWLSHMAPGELSVGLWAEMSAWRWVAKHRRQRVKQVSKLSNTRSWENLPGWVAGRSRFHYTSFLYMGMSTASTLSGCSTGRSVWMWSWGTVDWKVCAGRTLWALEGFGRSPPTPPTTLQGGLRSVLEDFSWLRKEDRTSLLGIRVTATTYVPFPHIISIFTLTFWAWFIRKEESEESVGRCLRGVVELFQVTQLVWTVAGFLPDVSASKICALNPCLLLPVTGSGLSPILGCCFKKKIIKSPSPLLLGACSPFPWPWPPCCFLLVGASVPVPACC